MALQVASLFGVLSLDDSDFKRKLDDSRNGMQRFGSNLQTLGAQATVATAPIALGMGYAIDQTRRFDRTMSNINAIIMATGDEASALRSELLAYGSDTVAGPQKTAEAYYEIVSGVADATTHMAILDAATRTSEAGQADPQATTSALISTMNSYKLQAEDVQYVSDVFTRTVGVGVLTMDELASALPQATGLAAQFGVGLDETAGGLAYMTTQGFSAAQSATFLKGMITTLLNPTEDLKGVITSLGFESGQALLESEGLVGAYQLLAQQNGGLAGLITNQEALTGSILLTNETATTFLGDFTTGIEGATAAAGEIQNQTESRDKCNSTMEHLGIVVGTTVMPIITDFITNTLIPGLQSAAEWAQNNPELTKTLLMIAGASVILGPLLIGIGTAINTIGTVSGLAQTAVKGLRGTMLGSVVGILAVGVAIAGVIAQIHEFNRLVGEQAQATHEKLKPQIESGAITRQMIADEAFRQTQEQFGDLGARLIFGSGALNIQGHVDTAYTGMTGSQATQGQLWTGYATGGDNSGGMPILTGEHGPEVWVPSGAGHIYNSDQTRAMMGGDTYYTTVVANDRAGGAAAGEAFEEKLRARRRRT